MVSYYAPHSEISASHRRGVRYIVPVLQFDMFCGAMNTVKEGHKYKKHIVVRRVPRRGGHVLQLYTYRFPKTWSAACVANRNLIKEAQRRAHALEHDHSLAALEWRTRFFHHYYTVFKGGAKPEPGMKRYSRFYQYTYVAIYRQLKAAQQQAEEVSFEPVSDSFTSSLSEPVLDTPHVSHPVSANEILAPLLRRSKYSGKNVLLRMGNAKARAGGTAFFAE